MVPIMDGEQMKIRITRANGSFLEGDEPTVEADYGKALIENGLAEEIKAQPKPKSKAKS
ncbi:hypothetical protein [Alteripontixanthobacter muriae]|uniref:hypothetical protein n=1 Tax=Alteripontixanthobacter muriae TaxID=2705546 RepID=UPI0019D69446|nr:hypothetical protein [Alteripontixanthobacter muriae]